MKKIPLSSRLGTVLLALTVASACSSASDDHTVNSITNPRGIRVHPTASSVIPPLFSLNDAPNTAKKRKNSSPSSKNSKKVQCIRECSISPQDDVDNLADLLEGDKGTITPRPVSGVLFLALGVPSRNSIFMEQSRRIHQLS